MQAASGRRRERRRHKKGIAHYLTELPHCIIKAFAKLCLKNQYMKVHLSPLQMCGLSFHASSLIRHCALKDKIMWTPVSLSFFSATFILQKGCSLGTAAFIQLFFCSASFFFSLPTPLGLILSKSHTCALGVICIFSHKQNYVKTASFWTQLITLQRPWVGLVKLQACIFQRTFGDRFQIKTSQNSCSCRETENNKAGPYKSSDLTYHELLLKWSESDSKIS